MSDLKSGLLVSADLWTEAHGGAPHSRLGKAVAGDANFFARIAAPSASLNLTTLEKFAVFLGHPENWPTASIPADVLNFVARVKGQPCKHKGVDAAPQVQSSTGQMVDLSGSRERVA